jgi:HEAT repeat protein
MSAKKSKSTAKKYSAIPQVAAPAKKAADAVPAAEAKLAEVKANEVKVAEAKVAEKATTAPAATEKSAAATHPVEAKAAAPAAEAKPAAAPVAHAAKAEAAPAATDVSADVAALQNTCADTASEAAIRLGTAGNKAAVEPLVAVVANADGYYHSVVRAAAAASLGQLGDARAVPALVTAINDEMAEASAEAVRALAVLGDRRAVAPLVDVIENAGGFFLPVVRRAAVIALAKLGGPEAKAALAAVAQNDHEDAVVRQAAATAAV